MPTSLATRVTSEAKALSWSTMTLIVFLSSRISPFTSTVIFFERSPEATAVVTSAMLRTWPVRFSAIRLTLSVRSFQVPATPSTRAWPPSLPSVPTSRATRVTSEAKRVELVDHDVDRVLQLEDLALHLDGDLLGKVARGDGGGHLGDVADLAGEVGRHGVDVVGEVLPGAGDALHVRLAAQLALGADLAGDAGHLGGEGGELLDHRVDDLADAKELAPQRPAVDLDRHRLRQVALGDRADHARDLGGRLDHVLDQLVDRADRRFPAPGRRLDPAALADLAFLADDLGEPLELVGHLLVEGDGLVEQAGDLAVLAGEVFGETDGEVAPAEAAERAEELAAIDEIARGLYVQLFHSFVRLPPARSHCQAPARAGNIAEG